MKTIVHGIHHTHIEVHDVEGGTAAEDGGYTPITIHSTVVATAGLMHADLCDLIDALTARKLEMEEKMMSGIKERRVDTAEPDMKAAFLRGFHSVIPRQG